MSEQNTGWRDISTAPRNGTIVLVREDDGCVYSANFCPLEQSWKLADQDGWRWNDDLARVAHWRALPPPPGEEAERDALQARCDKLEAERDALRQELDGVLKMIGGTRSVVDGGE